VMCFGWFQGLPFLYVCSRQALLLTGPFTTHTASHHWCVARVGLAGPCMN
jgi:hypothetical protein